MFPRIASPLTKEVRRLWHSAADHHAAVEIQLQGKNICSVYRESYLANIGYMY